MSKYETELYRLSTFGNWPLDYPGSYALARAGLYFTGKGDEVCCYKCHCLIRNWKASDNPSERHRVQSPTCPLSVPSNASVPSYASVPPYPSVAHTSLPSTLIAHPTDEEEELNETVSSLTEQRWTNPDDDIRGLVNNVAPMKRNFEGLHINVEQTKQRDFEGLHSNVAPPGQRDFEGFHSNVAPTGQRDFEVLHSNVAPTGQRDFEGLYSNVALPRLPDRFPVPETSSSSNHTSADPNINISMPRPSEFSVPVTAPVPPSASLPVPVPSDLHMKSEAIRLRTFETWTNSFMKPEDLAREGFYYMNIGDCVKCAFCHGILKSWESGDNPSDEHRRHFPKCLFVLKQDVGNIPLPPRQVGLRREAMIATPTQVFDKLPVKDHSLQQNFDIDYKERDQRLSSFKNHQLPTGHTPERLAEAGFYYVGPGDSMKCFNCGGVLKKWSVLDDPWIEHAKWFPHCTYLLATKGHLFVEAFHKPKSQKKEATTPQDIASSAAPSLQDEDEETRLKEGAEESTIMKMPFVRDPASFVTTPPPSTTSSLPSPILHSPSKTAGEKETGRDTIICKICMDEPANIVFTPCGHFLCCENCAPAMSECPICRREIKESMKVFIP